MRKQGGHLLGAIDLQRLHSDELVHGVLHSCRGWRLQEVGADSRSSAGVMESL